MIDILLVLIICHGTTSITPVHHVPLYSAASTAGVASWQLQGALTADRELSD